MVPGGIVTLGVWNSAWVFYCTDLGMLRVTDGLLSGLSGSVLG